MVYLQILEISNFKSNITSKTFVSVQLRENPHKSLYEPQEDCRSWTQVFDFESAFYPIAWVALPIHINLGNHSSDIRLINTVDDKIANWAL